MVVKKSFERVCIRCVVVGNKCFVELLHALVADGQNARSGLEQDFVCQRQAGALVAVPKQLRARAPAKGRQRPLCRGCVGGKNRGQLLPHRCFLRHRRRVVRAGDSYAPRAQLAPLQSLVASNEAVELAKEYGNDNGPSFVNGILGNIVNE